MLSARWQALLGPAAGEIRAVLLDAVGTLITPIPPVAEVYRTYGARHGAFVDEATIMARFRQALRAGNADDGQTDEAHEHARWRGIVRHVFGELTDVEMLFQELWAHFASPLSWRLAPHANSLFAQVAAAGCAFGVASNFDARLHPVLTGPDGLLPDAEVFVSSELGCQKPHVGFFRAIERQLGLQPAEIVLVGDDWGNDVLGAQTAGWKSIWLSVSGCQSAISSGIPHVESLGELCD